MKSIFGKEVKINKVTLVNQEIHTARFNKKRAVQVWTDGSCLACRMIDGKKIPDRCGGWGYYMEKPKKVGVVIKKKSGWALDTTISRMELIAVLRALSRLKDRTSVTVYTDSQYVQIGANDRLPLWIAAGMRKASGGAVENVDLWKKLVKQMNRLYIKFVWVKGHAGIVGNEEADRLAGNGRKKALAAKAGVK